VDSLAFAGTPFLLEASSPPERGLESLGDRGRGTDEFGRRGECARAASELTPFSSGVLTPTAARVGGVPRDPGGSDAGLDGLAWALSAAFLEDGGGGSERMRRLLSQTGVKKPDR